MKTLHVSISEKSRKACVLGILLLTIFAVFTLMTLGITNQFEELIRYSGKELLQISWSGMTLVVLFGFFYRMIKSDFSNALNAD